MANLTTIPLRPDVRDRLKMYGTMGDTYNDILTRLMDHVEREAFIQEMRRIADDPNTEWVDLEAVKWD